MKEIIRYVLETLACSGVLYGAYALLLKNRTGYLAARLYLIGATLLAALIPLLSIPVWPGQAIVATAGIPTATIVTDAPAADAIAPGIIVWIVYGCGVFLLLSSMLRQAIRIRRLRKNSPSEKIGGIVLTRPSEPISSFSFFGTVYISSAVSEKDIPAIVAHERSHIVHRHSLERIVMEVLKTLLWWNPFAWLTARSLAEVEEFEADHDVLNEGYEVETYIETIFTQLFGYSPDIANSLRNSLTKKRLLMMTTPKKSRYALLRLAATLPCIAALVTAFGFTAKAAEIRLVPQQQAPLASVPADQPVPISFTADSVTTADGRLTAKQFSLNRSEDDSILLVLDGEATDFSTDPATGQRSFTATGNVTYRIVPESGFTPEIRTRYGRYLQGKTAILFFETQEYAAKSALQSDITDPEINSQAPAAVDRQNTASEELPKFQGGDVTTFRNWVNSRIRYPEEAFKNNLGGKVVAQFTVGQDGSVGDITILQSPDKCFSDEVTRILKSSPKWTPGRNDKGNAVKVSLVIPIDFRMTAEKPSGN